MFELLLLTGSTIGAYIGLTIFTVLSFVLVGWLFSKVLMLRHLIPLNEMVANRRAKREARKQKQLRTKYRIG